MTDAALEALQSIADELHELNRKLDVAFGLDSAEDTKPAEGGEGEFEEDEAEALLAGIDRMHERARARRGG